MLSSKKVFFLILMKGGGDENDMNHNHRPSARCSKVMMKSKRHVGALSCK